MAGLVSAFGCIAGLLIAAVVSLLFRAVEGRWPNWQWWIFIPIGAALLFLGIAKGIERP